jgi:hypothetical protein
MPRWRANYFGDPRDEAPSRSEIIQADNESDALYEERDKMGSICSRAEVIRLDPKSDSARRANFSTFCSRCLLAHRSGAALCSRWNTCRTTTNSASLLCINRRIES